MVAPEDLHDAGAGGAYGHEELGFELVAAGSPAGADGHLSARVCVAGLGMGLVRTEHPEVMYAIGELVPLGKVDIIGLLDVVLPLGLFPASSRCSQADLLFQALNIPSLGKHSECC